MKRVHPAALSLLSAFCSSMVAGCLDAGTGGRAVLFDFQIANAPVGDRPLGTFTTDDGWDVQLTDAHVAFGPVYLYEKPAPLAFFEEVSRLIIPTAYAHAGDNHFNGGQVLGELAEYLVYDALAAEPRTFEKVGGIFGQSQSFGFELPKTPVTEGAPLNGQQAFVRGTATKDGEIICFQGGTSPENDTRRSVDGLPFSATLDDGGTVLLDVHVSHWLEHAAIDALTAEDADGCKVITATDAVGSSWSAALRDREGITAQFRFRPGAEP